MSNFALSRVEYVFPQIETTYGIVPNTTGTATVAGANCCRTIKTTMASQTALIRRPDKTGSRSQVVGSKGRSFSNWSTHMSLAPNGTAGTAPDMDPFLQAIFGVAPTVVASTSVTYNLNDAIKSLSLYSFRTPSTLDQRVCLGAVAQEMTLSLGQDVADVQFSGEGLWTLSSNQFSAADTTQKGGLTAFPSMPGSPVTNGGMVVGFTGSLTIAGTAVATLRTASVRIRTGNVVVKDTFGSYYPTSTEGDEREVTVDLSIYEDDSASYAALIAASNAKTPVSLVMVCGTTAGSIATCTVANLQLTSPTQEEQRRYITNWSGSMGHASSLTTKDEVILAFT